MFNEKKASEREEKKIVKIIVSATIKHAKPAHHAFVQARGSGTNLKRAMRSAVDDFFEQKEIKGKRGLLPFTMVFTSDGDDQGED